MSELGVNLSFAIKRWPDPQSWGRVVRDELELRLVQFTFDLLDPWWPDGHVQAGHVREVAAELGIEIHSIQMGLGRYVSNGLLHPDRAVRSATQEMWGRGCAIAAAMGAGAIGGPLGALSVADNHTPGMRHARYGDLVDALLEIAETARAEGVDALLVEPTPCQREIPSSVEECLTLAADMRAAAVPIKFVIDVGHALFHPLYGTEVTLRDWLTPLVSDLAAVHLQNTDFLRDAHWGWPHGAGLVDVAEIATAMTDVGLDDTPVFLELFDSFEASDDAVLETTRSSVAHCREHFPAQRSRLARTSRRVNDSKRSFEP